MNAVTGAKEVVLGEPKRTTSVRLKLSKVTLRTLGVEPPTAQGKSDGCASRCSGSSGCTTCCAG